MPSWSSPSPDRVGEEQAALVRRFVEASRRAEIVTLINLAASEQDVAQVTADELCEAFDAEVAFVVVTRPGEGARDLVGRVGLTEELVAPVTGDRLVTAALGALRAQVHRGGDLLGVGGRRAVLSPWTGESGRQVVVAVVRLYDESFEPSEIALLEAVTGSVGHALERCWLGEERDRHAARQGALARAAGVVNASLVRKEVLDRVGREVERALQADLVAVCLHDDAHGLRLAGGCGIPRDAEGQACAPGGLSERVVRTGIPLVVQPFDGEVPLGLPGIEGLRSALAAPLRRGDEVDGVLLAGYQEERWIADADLELLVAFAELAGVAAGNAEAHAAAQRAASVDPLTGCLNHGAFQARLREEVARAERDAHPFALALVDVNDFKAVNDRFGHLRGDAVLRAVAEILKRAVRSYDLVGRYGGDEFALLLPSTDAAVARVVIDRALVSVGRLTLPDGSAVSASAGLTAWRAGDEADHLIERADRTLLEAKRARTRSGGRARSEAAPAPPDPDDHQRLRRLAAVSMLGTRLARLVDARAIAEGAIAELTASLGYECCLLGRRGPRDTVAIVASRFDGGRCGPPGDALGLDGALQRCLSKGRTVLMSESAEDRGPGSELAVPVLVDGRLWGALALRAGESGAFGEEDARLAESVAEHVGAALRTAELYAQLEDTYLGTAAALAAALEAKDSYTADHAASIAETAVSVGRELGLDEPALRDLRYGAIFHDIGKIAIPDAILNKPSSLSEAELAVIRRHPEVGEQILAPVPFLAGVRRIVRHDHERWDGAGYPDGLRAEGIPPGARIVLVVDAYHAMVSDRPYRRAMRPADARSELLAHAGRQFDPSVVRALLRVLERRE